MVRAAANRIQGVVNGQDSWHETAGRRGDGRVLCREDRRRHQKESQFGGGVQELSPAAGHAGQEHPGVHAGRPARGRHPPPEHRRPGGRVAAQRVQQSSITHFKKEYMKEPVFYRLEAIYRNNHCSCICTMKLLDT